MLLTRSVSVFAAAFICSSTVAIAAGPYFVTDIGDLPGGSLNTYAFSINSFGQVVGEDEDLVQRAVLWTPTVPNGTSGSLMYLGDIPGGRESQFGWSINSRGQVVGFARGAPDELERAFLWTPTSPNGTTGSMIDLGDLPGGADSSEATGINSFGQVTGQSTATVAGRAFLWTPTTPNGTSGAMIDLGELPGGQNYSRGNDINSHGQVVGRSSAVTQGNDHAFLWTPTAPNGTTGSMIDLGNLPGGMDESIAKAINSYGQVVGLSSYSSVAEQRHHAFLWTPITPNGTSGTMIDLGDLPGGLDLSWAEGIGENGEVLGSVGVEGGSRAFMWMPATANGTAGTMINLNTRMEPQSGEGWTLLEAWDMNEYGQIVGVGHHSGNVRGFILTPIPEPTSWMLVSLIGMICLFSRQNFNTKH
jgi:probable HAF family extracellular repeat protein